MKVEQIAHTPNPDGVCAVSANACVSKGIYGVSDFTDDGQIGKSLKHALASGHESVCEHAVFTFAIEGISRACSHQLVRHRMASYSQQSQRYVEVNPFKYVKPKSIEEDEDACERYDEIMMEIYGAYAELLRLYDIPEEDARYILPNACTTNIIVSMNGRELMHFFGLRCCTRAQWEIRELAKKMLKQVKQVAPILFEKAGPQCKKLGYCPEAKGCGRYPPKKEALGLDMCVLSEVEE